MPNPTPNPMSETTTTPNRTHGGIAVGVDDTDHMVLFCPACDKPLSVQTIFKTFTDTEHCSNVLLKCSCGFTGQRKFYWQDPGTDYHQIHRTDALKSIGNLIPAEVAVLKVHKGKAASDDGKQTYEIGTALNGSPIITSNQSRKLFHITWNTIVDLAVKAGIDLK